MVKRSIYFAAGCIFISVGLVGFLLPLFPGFVPFIIGIVMLSKSSTYIRRNLSRLKTVFPRQYAKLHEIKEKLSHKK
ncbi:MAG: hypothetical protein A2132_00700 [Nitrospirae bacterium RBG_16_43_11]|nr:MAG: hypothetical protein A2132_00700 [Nitrospirae bacterium RBG_16_43_11]